MLKIIRNFIVHHRGHHHHESFIPSQLGQYLLPYHNISGRHIQMYMSPTRITTTKTVVLPFPATEENCQKLENWLKSYYASSTFNTCSHQLPPMMDTKPLCLMIDPNAALVTHHTPIPAPVHCQEEVNTGLNQAIWFAVIELVPIDEPITWCHRMVICAKKNPDEQ